MKFESLDRLFEQVEQRSKENKLMSEPYGMGPLASDHFLLSKSWVYFKERIKQIENQYQELFESKDKKIKALEASLSAARDHECELEKKHKEYDRYEKSLIYQRHEDYVDFKKKNQKLIESWQQERIVLEQKITELEHRVKAEKQSVENIRSQAIQREKDLLQVISKLKLEKQDLVHDRINLQKTHASELELRAEEVQGRESRIDLMRQEIERRDQMIRELVGEGKNKDRHSASLEKTIDNLKTDIIDRDKEIQLLKSKIEILNKEKENMKASWDREQAEWRELWDRDRENWDRHRRQMKDQEEGKS